MKNHTASSLKLDKFSLMLFMKLILMTFSLQSSMNYAFEVNMGIVELKHSFSMSVNLDKGE
ncbi:hypothetical protein MSG66_16540 [Acinetobacter sp. IK31]|uniref:hypothetical protein n=1 Tax=Acinetobacter sp. IK31 TaxID=2928895 RepID=UPI002D2173D0|nr:hypothetical protein [Acinetobacter sp. IK31]MEB3865606.1 hypothetical protein [Acinetobacter sp. IK31]